MKRLLLVSALALSVLTAACGSGSDTAAPSASTAPGSTTASATATSATSATASEAAAIAGCTDVEQQTLTPSDVDARTRSAVSCRLDGTKIQIYTFESKQATTTAFRKGQAAYRAFEDAPPTFVAVGDTWIASEVPGGSLATATRLAKVLGGQVESLTAE